jgi:prephenate dehydratase
MHFLLPESGLVITGEHFLHIRHTLMAMPNHGKITEVMSHPQALGQCRHWMRAQSARKSRTASSASSKLKQGSGRQLGKASSAAMCELAPGAPWKATARVVSAAQAALISATSAWAGAG